MVLSPSLSFKRNELKERGNIIAFESTYPQAKPPISQKVQNYQYCTIAGKFRENCRHSTQRVVSDIFSDAALPPPPSTTN